MTVHNVEQVNNYAGRIGLAIWNTLFSEVVYTPSSFN